MNGVQRSKMGSKEFPLKAVPLVPASEQFALMAKRAKQARNEYLLRKGKGGEVDLGLLTERWTKTMQRTFPEFLGFVTRKDMMILQSALYRTKLGSATHKLSFVEWCVEKWEEIKLAKFRNARSYPDFPSPRYLVACMRTFEEYSTMIARRIAKQATMTPEERFGLPKGKVVPPDDQSPANQPLRTPVMRVAKGEAPIYRRPGPMPAGERKKVKLTPLIDGGFGKWTEEDDRRKNGTNCVFRKT